MTRRLRAISSVATRELIHLVRRPMRILVTLITPVLLWFTLSAGFAGNTTPAELLPGMLLLLASFGTVFVSIALIQDRTANLTAAALAVGAYPADLILGKAFVATISITAQSLILIVIAALTIADISPLAVLLTTFSVAGTALFTASLGLAIAWRSASVAEFHAVINLLLPALWLLSGSVFQPSSAANWLATIMLANPLAWCHSALDAAQQADLSSPTPFLAITPAALAMVVLAASIANLFPGDQNG